MTRTPKTLLAVMALLCGCSSTRYVTPWLRITRTDPVVIIAESGGPKPRYTVEQKLCDDWTEVSDSPLVMSIDGGRWVAIHHDDTFELTNRRGRRVLLSVCTGMISSPSDSPYVDCFAGEPPDMTWYRFELRADRASARAFRWPHGQLGMLGYDAERRPVLFSRDDTCLAARLDGAGLTTLAVAKPKGVWDCIEIAFWRSAGVDVEPGEPVGP